MKTKKFKEQKQNLIEHLLDICHVKTGERKIIIDLLEEIKAIDNKLDKKKRKQPLFLLEHGLADIGDFKPISVKTKECLDYYDKLMSVLRPTFDVDQKVIDKLKTEEYIEFEISPGHKFKMNDQLFEFVECLLMNSDGSIKVKAKR